jgi:hypothetical protein
MVALVSMKLPGIAAALLLELPLVPVAPMAPLPEPDVRHPVTVTVSL